jgi:hypothetical protein
MKIALACALVIASVTMASAQYQGNTGSGLNGTGSNPNSHSVSPYVNSHGTYVQGHQQANPNNTQLDNYGTRGNFNPNTGTYGTRAPRY